MLLNFQTVMYVLVILTTKTSTKKFLKWAKLCEKYLCNLTLIRLWFLSSAGLA